MNKLLIVGGGPSIRWDIVRTWDGDVIACDVYSWNVLRFGNRLPSYVITLEDGEAMQSLFDWQGDARTNVVISTRTQPKLIEFIKSKGFTVEKFDSPLLEVIWNVGQMAWLYAWQQLSYREIYLTGFDSLKNPDPSLLERWWVEGFMDMKKLLAPKDLKTYLIGNRREEQPPTPQARINNDNHFIEYRKKRDEFYMSRQLGNDAEPLYERLL